MELERITLVIEPERFHVDSTLRKGTVSAREFFGYDRLFEELRRSAPVEVGLFEGSLRDAPTSGMLLLHPGAQVHCSLQDCDASSRAAIAARILLLDAEQSPFELLETHHLAGAIESLRLVRLQYPETGAAPAGLIGLSSVGLRMGVMMLEGYPSTHYAMLSGGGHPNFVALLVAYLQAYVRSR